MSARTATAIAALWDATYLLAAAEDALTRVASAWIPGRARLVEAEGQLLEALERYRTAARELPHLSLPIPTLDDEPPGLFGVRQHAVVLVHTVATLRMRVAETLRGLSAVEAHPSPAWFAGDDDEARRHGLLRAARIARTFTVHAAG
jgi:hypothetical protein